MDDIRPSGIRGLQPLGGGGGGGAVDSVNGQTGAVVLDTGDIADIVNSRYVTDANLLSLNDLKIVPVANATGVAATDTANIQAAFASATAGTLILLQPNVTYVINETSVTPPDNCKIDGSNATIQISATATDADGDGYIGGFQPEGVKGSKINVSGSLAQGAIAVTTSAPHGLAAGDRIMIGSDDDSSPNRTGNKYGEWNTVLTAPTTTTLTLLNGTEFAYTTTPYIYKYTTMPKNFTIGKGLKFTASAAHAGSPVPFIPKYIDGLYLEPGVSIDGQDVSRVGFFPFECLYIKGTLRVTRCADKNRTSAVEGYGVYYLGCKYADLDIFGYRNKHTVDATGYGDRPMSSLITGDVYADNDYSAGISTHAGSHHIRFKHCVAYMCCGSFDIRGEYSGMDVMTVVGHKYETAPNGQNLGYDHGIVGEGNNRGTATASASSSGTTLISSASYFVPSDVGRVIYNTTDSTSAIITAYTSATQVTTDITIGDTWDGNTIEFGDYDGMAGRGFHIGLLEIDVTTKASGRTIHGIIFKDGVEDATIDWIDVKGHTGCGVWLQGNINNGIRIYGDIDQSSDFVGYIPVALTPGSSEPRTTQVTTPVLRAYWKNVDIDITVKNPTIAAVVALGSYTATSDATSTGTALIMPSATFLAGDVGSKVFNITSGKTKTIDAYTSPTQVTVSSAETNTFTITIAAPGVVTKVNHGLITGSEVILSTTGALPTGLVAGTRYYAISIDTDTLRLATSAANAIAGTAITTTGSQSGVHTMLDTWAGDLISFGFSKCENLTIGVKLKEHNLTTGNGILDIKGASGTVNGYVDNVYFNKYQGSFVTDALINFVNSWGTNIVELTPNTTVSKFKNGDVKAVSQTVDNVTTGTGVTLGTLNVIDVFLESPEVVRKLGIFQVVGGTVVTNMYGALYSVSLSGLVAQSDNKASLGATANIEIEFNIAPKMCKRGWQRVGFFVSATTSPTFVRGGNGPQSNYGQGNDYKYATTTDIGLTTTMPATHGARSALTTSYFVSLKS
jgi:hypothetical protein